jgi:hypothetical protein
MKELMLKGVGVALFIIGIIVVGVSIMAMMIISRPDYGEVQSMRTFYAFSVLLGIGIGIAHGFLGFNLFKLKRIAIYLTIILSAILIFATSWMFIKVGYLMFPINAILFAYLLIFIITLFAVFIKDSVTNI